MKKGKDDMINLYSTERLAEVLSGIVFRHECNTFIELREQYGKNSIIILGLLPYLALFSVEAQSYFESIGVPIDIQNQSGYEAKDVRIIIKQFNERFGKARKKVISVDEAEDKRYKEKLKFSFLRYLGANYNLSILFDDKSIVSDTQYAMSMFEGQDPEKENLIAFGKSLGQMLGSVRSLLGEGDVIPTNVRLEKINWYKKDINTRKKDLFILPQNEDKAIQLLMLHTLAAINFAFIEINKILGKNTLKTRILYTSMYYAREMLGRIEEKIIDNDMKLEIEECLKKLKPVFNLEFRNCLMHYSFKNDDGLLIKKEYFDVNEEFFGLVESCFNGMTFDEFIVNVNDNLKTMSEKIQEFCAVELKHLDFFDKSY